MSDKILEKVSFETVVTDRGLEECQKLAHFKVVDIPRDARVLNLGSGLLQSFEGELKSARPDVKIISIDPTLVLTGYEISRDNRESVRVGIDETRKRVISLRNREGTIAALGQKLPISSSSVD